MDYHTDPQNRSVTVPPGVCGDRFPLDDVNVEFICSLKLGHDLPHMDFDQLEEFTCGEGELMEVAPRIPYLVVWPFEKPAIIAPEIPRPDA